MAITLSLKKFNNREYAYIVENYRDPSTKRPTSRTLESYGCLDKLLAGDPDALKKLEARVKALRADSKAYAGAAKEQLLKGVTVTPDRKTKHVSLLLKSLREAGLALSAAETIAALESVKIQQVSGLKKANSHLFVCSTLESESVLDSEEADGQKAPGMLCDEILRACGMEPLNGVETASTLLPSCGSGLRLTGSRTSVVGGR